MEHTPGWLPPIAAMHTRPADSQSSRSGAVLVLALAAWSLPACATRGNGEASAEDRTVETFHGVDVGGVFTLEAAEGSPASVRVEGDANLVPLVETRVEDGVLHVTTRERISPSLALVVRVRTPELREVDVSGAADATITTSQPSFELDVSGASDVTLRGTTQDLELDISGASEVDATELRAANVDVEASGASEADVTATASLDAEASGASEIRYGGGAAQVSKDVSGAAKIIARTETPANPHRVEK